jgi:hypothetical protein
VGAGVKPGNLLAVGFLGKVNEERKKCTNINVKINNIILKLVLYSEYCGDAQ